ncbi:hypothetical protein [Yersinia sp. 2545 StPb PI]|uniref:hypothetical protein n=1 Tax=Yersinia sp. 2545 StPb PI TaxID=3117410 RepID=UPI003FA470B8
MKNMKKFTLAAVAALTLVSQYSTAATGDLLTVPGASQQVSADLVFAAPGVLTATLTPTGGLSAGQLANGAVLASGAVDASLLSAANQSAVNAEWLNGTIYMGINSARVIPGKNPANTIRIMLADNTYSGFPPSPINSGVDVDMSNGTGDFFITSMAQTVVADTYTVNILFTAIEL